MPTLCNHACDVVVAHALCHVTRARERSPGRPHPQAPEVVAGVGVARLVPFRPRGRRVCSQQRLAAGRRRLLVLAELAHCLGVAARGRLGSHAPGAEVGLLLLGLLAPSLRVLLHLGDGLIDLALLLALQPPPCLQLLMQHLLLVLLRRLLPRLLLRLQLRQRLLLRRKLLLVLCVVLGCLLQQARRLDLLPLCLVEGFLRPVAQLRPLIQQLLAVRIVQLNILVLQVRDAFRRLELLPVVGD
mmetsp:Transcript_26760/g.41162  ORF Transcript_26760/g.41162 Transcript_26760/m.41162 type:complete len:243 (+) Transcript_26760:315-1043(+)